MGTTTQRTTPQPETREERLPDAGPRRLSARDYRAILARAARETVRDQIPDAAAAMAYYAFLAIPALLLLGVGVFSLVGGESAITTILDKVGTVAPSEAVDLLGQSLRRTTREGGGVAMIAVGGVIALWTATGAMNALMRALNRAYDRGETRGFVRQRMVALAMLVLLGLAFLAVFGLLVLGPKLSGWIGSATGLESEMTWIWWAGQWPLLLVLLLLAFTVVLHMGPDVDHPRWSILTIGSLVAVLGWLGASALFAFYVANVGSYNKAWGSLAAVIIMLTWLWLSSLVLLFGAEVNSEAERSRELRRGEPAQTDLRAPATGGRAPKPSPY